MFHGVAEGCCVSARISRHWARLSESRARGYTFCVSFMIRLTYGIQSSEWNSSQAYVMCIVHSVRLSASRITVKAAVDFFIGASGRGETYVVKPSRCSIRLVRKT